MGLERVGNGRMNLLVHTPMKNVFPCVRGHRGRDVEYITHTPDFCSALLLSWLRSVPKLGILSDLNKNHGLFTSVLRQCQSGKRY